MLRKPWLGSDFSWSTSIAIKVWVWEIWSDQTHAEKLEWLPGLYKMVVYGQWRYVNRPNYLVSKIFMLAIQILKQGGRGQARIRPKSLSMASADTLALALSPVMALAIEFAITIAITNSTVQTLTLTFLYCLLSSAKTLWQLEHSFKFRFRCWPVNCICSPSRSNLEWICLPRLSMWFLLDMGWWLSLQHVSIATTHYRDCQSKQLRAQPHAA